MRPPRVRALARERVDGLLDQVWDHRMTLVIGPAGAGKTTALAQFAERSPDPVAWYRAEATDGSVAGLLAHLQRACSDALGDLPGAWDSPSSVAGALERWNGNRAVLVMDDLHALRGTPAEALVERLVDYLPAHVAVAVASRTPPSFDLTRLRLTGELLEIGADDLRFRTWEAEQLFRDLYGTLLPPEDLARLTRRVEGWAAGLQLYHLASRSKTPAEQRRLIDVVSSRSRLAREYLTRNVLDELAPQLRSFLIDTCVLGVVTPALADRLLGRTDSAQVLRELEAMQLFTIPIDDEGAYRYHEVLRSHLEVLLAERDGDDAVLRRHAAAGALLEAEGLVAEALRCYGRSNDREAVSRLVGTDQDVADTFRWLDTMPPAIVEADPWLLLARARAALAAGRLRDAVADYQAAERLFGDAGPAERCRRERLELQGWLDPRSPPSPGWTAILRNGLRRDPVTAGQQLAAMNEPNPLAAAGALALMAADLPRAAEWFEAAIVHPDASSAVVHAAHLGRAVADLLSPASGAPAQPIDAAEAAAEAAGVGWLARLARASLALTDRRAGVEEAARVALLCDADDDRWGAALARLVEGLGGLGYEDAATAPLEDAARRSRALDAPVIESLALGALAVAYARAGDPQAHATALAAEHLGRTVGSLGGPAMAFVALAALEPANRHEHLEMVRQLGMEGGFALPTAGDLPPGTFDPGSLEPLPAGVEPTAAALEVRCFGPFTVIVHGRVVDLASLRPRARAAFRLLALQAGRAVHREVLLEALWPDSDPDAGLRNLQVALSSIRQLLTAAGGDGAALVSRDGDAYRLALDRDASDLAVFEAAVDAAHTARSRGSVAEAVAAGHAALAAYAGELLAEEGPADWVVGGREKYRLDAAAMATLIAEAALADGRATDAASSCERGLRIDRYHDGLWRLLADAHEAAGDRAAAARARSGYRDVMNELGVK